jgi:hypothetical protein
LALVTECKYELILAAVPKTHMALNEKQKQLIGTWAFESVENGDAFLKVPFGFNLIKLEVFRRSESVSFCAKWLKFKSRHFD